MLQHFLLSAEQISSAAINYPCLKRIQLTVSSELWSVENTCNTKTLTLKILWLNEKHSITFSSKPLSERTRVLRLPSEFKYLPNRETEIPRTGWAGISSTRILQPSSQTLHTSTSSARGFSGALPAFSRIPPPNLRQAWFPHLQWSTLLTGYCFIIPAWNYFSLGLRERLLERKSVFQNVSGCPKWQIFSQELFLKEDNLPTRSLLFRFTQLPQLSSAPAY